MSDQLFIEVDPHVDVIIGGRGKTSGDAFSSQGEREPTALGLQGKRSVLELHGSSNSWLYSMHVLLAVGEGSVRMVAFDIWCWLIPLTSWPWR